jgi:hypothetical protein
MVSVISNRKRLFGSPGRIVAALISLVVMVYLAAILLAGFVSGPVCVPVPGSSINLPRPIAVAVFASQGAAAKSGSNIAADSTLTACAQHPSFGQHALYLLTYAYIPVWAGAFLVAFSMQLMIGANPEPFTPRLARMLRLVGATLVFGNLFAILVAGLARKALLDGMLSQQLFLHQISDILPPSTMTVLWLPTVVGILLIAIGLIIKRGISMQEDVQGLV